MVVSSDSRVTHMQNRLARLPLQPLLPPLAETRQPALAAEEAWRGLLGRKVEDGLVVGEALDSQLPRRPQEDLWIPLPQT